MGNDLKKQAVSGVKWTSLFSAANGILGIVYRLILVSLLLPNEYAYIAVLSLFIGVSELVSNLGIGEAVLQKDSVNNNQLSSLYYFQILMAALLAVLLFVSAPLIESFYAYENLTLLLRYTSITLVFNGAASLFRIYLQKNFLFKWVVISNLSKLVFDMIITVTLVILGYGILGYVYGTVISTVLFTILMGYYCFKKTDIQLKFHFRLNDIKPFIRFGIFISLKQIFSFIASRIDEVIIGGFLSAEVLGVYFFAKDFIRKPQNLITQSFAQVMLPVFSKVKNELGKLGDMYTNASRYIGVIAFPVFIGLAVTASSYVPLLFGEEWLMSIWPIRIFAITGILLVLTANFSTSLLYALDYPNQVFYVEVVTNICYFILLFLVSNLGIYAILLAYVFYIFSKTFILQYLVSKNLKYTITRYILSLKTVAIFSIIMGASVYIVQLLLEPFNLWIQFLSSVLAGVIIYIYLLYFFEKSLIQKVYRLVKR